MRGKETIKVPVDECPAGPAMDAAVARALGWVKVECDGIYYWSDPTIDEWHNDRVASGRSAVGHKLEGAIVWSPSIDIAAAWELVEWMHQRINDIENGADDTLPFHLSTYRRLQLLSWGKKGERWWASFDSRNIAGFGNCFVSIAETVPLAICRAFLKANGIEYVEVPWKGIHYSVGEGIPLDHD